MTTGQRYGGTSSECRRSGGIWSDTENRRGGHQIVGNVI